MTGYDKPITARLLNEYYRETKLLANPDDNDPNYPTFTKHFVAWLLRIESDYIQHN